MATAALPHWDMTPFYPGLDSPELEADLAGVVQGIRRLGERFDAHGVRRRTEGLVAPETVAAFEEVTEAYNELLERVRTLNAYLSSFVATDARNALAQAKASELRTHLVELSKLGTRWEAWVGTADTDALLAASPLAREHAFALRRARVGARHQMGEAEEDLAATLHPAGPAAWGRLHGDLTSLILVEVRGPDGAVRELPMSAVRGLAHHPDPVVRRTAYEAELGAWERAAVPLAAAMNGIKGWASVLNRRRGWRDALEPSLHANNVDRATLEAMQAACEEAFPDFRRYLRAKARLLGRERLPWWDLFAPVGAEAERRWPFAQGAAFIVQQFATYSERLAGLADRAFRERWVDAEPRVGKRDGAFCMGVRGEESRLLCNYEESFDSVSTLAHELGHAYHNLNLAPRTPLQRQTPMALAETASIFCQTIVTNAALARAEGAEALALLEKDLQHVCQVVVDIHSRFLFEREVFSRRERRELGAEELNELMLEAQRRTYGDGLDPGALHPYLWAAKPHYYGSSFYNWPYTFGLLFGLGLYARYLEDPGGFRAGYDELLASTGMEDAATLASRFGIDVRSQGFWRSSLDVVRARIEQFEASVSAR